MERETTNRLPLKGNLALTYVASLVTALLMAAASVAGCLYGPVVYPTDELLQSFIPNDAVNLLIGVPILLGPMWLARRVRLIDLLLWPGALFYVLCNYLAHVLAVSVDVLYLLYLTLVTLSACAIIGLAASIDARAVDVVVVCVMGLVSLVPFALFVRGAVSRASSSSLIRRT
jgi:hypothetical protein